MPASFLSGSSMGVTESMVDYWKDQDDPSDTGVPLDEAYLSVDDPQPAKDCVGRPGLDTPLDYDAESNGQV